MFLKHATSLSSEPASNALPWVPLYTIERSGLPEITVQGISAVCEGEQPVEGLTRGQAGSHLWSRSLLKPLQLLCHLPVLQATYPKLRQRHFALMLSSHDGTPAHVQVLEEILDIARLPETVLQYDPVYPMSEAATLALKKSRHHPRKLYSACSGKHLAMILALHGQGHSISDYLDPDKNEAYQQLHEVLSWLFGPQPSRLTVDWCGMPNAVLTPMQMALLYNWLATGLPESVRQRCPKPLVPIMDGWGMLAQTMWFEPDLVGGADRLDSRLMHGKLTRDKTRKIVAKEGADGLIAVGVNAGPDYPDGLGLFVKIASGYTPKHMEAVIVELFDLLGLGRLHLVDPDPVLTTIYYFSADALTPREAAVPVGPPAPNDDSHAATVTRLPCATTPTDPSPPSSDNT